MRSAAQASVRLLDPTVNITATICWVLRTVPESAAALTIRANRRSHTNVRMHLQGYFKRMLTPAQKQELCEAIDKYRTGVFPLLVPLTLIRHYLREHPNPYLSDQVYLNPHPDTLKLRYGL